MPPDICIEKALWERFGWGPKDTEVLSLGQMRELFAILEQERISKNAVELGKPTEQKRRDLFAKKIAEQASIDDIQRVSSAPRNSPVANGINKGG